MKESPLHRLNFQQMLYLQALTEERHVTRAADRMGIGQPAMSTALARLRVLFNDVLLVKTSSGMEPTPRALELVKRIREIGLLVEGREFMEGDFEASRSTAHWRLLASDSTARTVFPALMAHASVHAPHMHFSVQPGDPRRLSEHLREGDSHLAISFVNSPPPNLRQTILYPQRLVCIARQDHPKIQEQLSLRQFVNSDHARWGVTSTIPSTLEEMVDEALRKLGETRRVSLHASSLTLLPAVIAECNLLAVVPEHLASSVRTSLPIQILPLPFAVPRADISMLWHERAHHDPAHRWLRETLREIGHKLASRPSYAS